MSAPDMDVQSDDDREYIDLTDTDGHVYRLHEPDADTAYWYLEMVNAAALAERGVELSDDQVEAVNGTNMAQRLLGADLVTEIRAHARSATTLKGALRAAAAWCQGTAEDGLAAWDARRSPEGSGPARRKPQDRAPKQAKAPKGRKAQKAAAEGRGTRS